MRLNFIYRKSLVYEMKIMCIYTKGNDIEFFFEYIWVAKNQKDGIEVELSFKKLYIHKMVVWNK